MAKIMNLTIFLIINMELASSNTWFWDFPLMEFNGDPSSKYDCREDQVAINFFKQVITEFVVKIAVDLVMALVNKTKGAILKKPSWKPEYELSKEIVWLLYFQAMIWVCQIFFPFLTAIVPIMLYALFKYAYFCLRRFQDRPKRSSNASDTGYFIMIFLNITLVSVSALIIVMMSVTMNHSQWVSVSY